MRVVKGRREGGGGRQRECEEREEERESSAKSPEVTERQVEAKGRVSMKGPKRVDVPLNERKARVRVQ
jgi:hypothetical protein